MVHDGEVARQLRRRQENNRAQVLAEKMTRATAASFFGFGLPNLLRGRSERCRALGGRYVFLVHGRGGGAWTIDLATASVRAGASDGADVRVEMSSATFDAILQDELDLGRCVREKGLRIFGALERLKDFALVLSG